MSFTPDRPIGFDPCGMAFGAIRAPYSAPARFFADSSGLDNRINWYIVPDDTPDYEGPTPFWPRVDVPGDEAHTVFEKEGWKPTRTIDWTLMFLPPLPPHDVHGDEQDFLGRSPSSKYPSPTSPCPVIRILPFGVRVGCRIRTVTPHVQAGFLVGADLFDPVVYAGFKVGGGVTDATPSESLGGVLFGCAYAFHFLEASFGGFIVGAQIATEIEAPTCDAAFEVELETEYTFTLADDSQVWFKHTTEMDDDLGTWQWTYTVEASDTIVATDYLQAIGHGLPFSGPCDLEPIDERTAGLPLPEFDVEDDFITGFFFSLQATDVGHPVVYTVRLDKIS